MRAESLRGELPAAPALSALVEELGPHPARTLGLDLAGGGEEVPGHWLVAAVLLNGRWPAERALAAYADLARNDCLALERLACCDTAALALRLESIGLPRSDLLAPRLVRVARGVAALDRSLDGLATEALGWEELAERLARLGPGFGRAGVLRFLRGLRERWPLAAEVPVDPAALCAAADLGLVEPETDAAAAASLLARGLADESPSPDLLDLEAALEALGRLACRPARADRCPLAAACPRREA